MSELSRTEDMVRDWLGQLQSSASAERVADAVLSSIPATSQESTSRTWTLLGGFARPAAIAAAVVVAFVGVSYLSRPGPPVLTSPSPSPSPSSSLSVTPSSGSLRPSAPVSLVPGVTVIDMGEPTWALAIDDQSVWVQVGDVGIGRIDRATNLDTGIRVAQVPQMQFEGGDLWALDVGTGIVRLDPLSGSILDTIPGISGFYLVIDGSTAWVADTGHSVDRVDLATGAVVATIDVPDGPKEMAIFDGGLWVTCDGGGVVARIDVATNKVVARIPAGNRPVNLAVGEGGVWVWNHERQLLRIDPATNKVVATIDGVAETLGVGVAVGGGSVWVAMPGGIGRVDPRTNLVGDVIPLGAGGYVDLAWFDGELWSSSTDRNFVYRIDPSP